MYKPGTIIRKDFGKVWHEGEVRSYDPKTKFYRVNYQDGDIEDMEYHEIKPLVKGDQKYKAYTCRTAYSLMLNHRQEARQSPKQVTHAAVIRTQRALTAACALAANKNLHHKNDSCSPTDLKEGPSDSIPKQVNH